MRLCTTESGTNVWTFALRVALHFVLWLDGTDPLLELIEDSYEFEWGVAARAARSSKQVCNCCFLPPSYS